MCERGTCGVDVAMPYAGGLEGFVLRMIGTVIFDILYIMYLFTILYFRSFQCIEK